VSQCNVIVTVSNGGRADACAAFSTTRTAVVGAAIVSPGNFINAAPSTCAI
jgi:hypothetical protein